jgi:hypothetical protein
VAVLHDGNLAATLYDAEMPGGTVRFAEFFTIDDGKIRSIPLMYDPALHLSRGGRLGHARNNRAMRVAIGSMARMGPDRRRLS